MADFDTFWHHYPRRIAKGAARLAFSRAIKKTTIECILAALEKYKAHKPDHIDWCHPATWLNGERWEDEWEPPATIAPVPIVRKPRDMTEAVAYCRDKFPNRVAEVERCQSLEDLPIFLKMIPNNWNAH